MDMSDEQTRQPDPTDDTEGHGVQRGGGDEVALRNASEKFAKDTFATDKAAQGEVGDDDDTEGHSVTPSSGDKFATDKFASDKFASDKFASDKFASDK
jgi:hypothetical protein